jgi:hypothetical protein
MSKEEKEQVRLLANKAAKEHFRRAGIPHWTASYQMLYPMYVQKYIKVYTAKINEQHNG